MLTLATAAPLPAIEGDGHVKLAAAVEFMHTATLLHDDVVDDSDMRRGKIAARMLWGNEASVLVGDFLLGQAFKMMVEVGSLQALDILSTAAAVIAEGEVLQLAAAKNTETTEDEYLAVIRGKTAALFAAACEVGAVIAGRPKAEQAACRSYGMNLGIAFQLVDDALDYGGASARSSARTSATISARARSRCRSCSPSGAATRTSAPSGSARCETSEAIATAISSSAIAIMRRHRAIDDTVERARHYGAMARDALALFPGQRHEARPARSGRFLHRARALSGPGKPLIRRCAPPSPRFGAQGAPGAQGSGAMAATAPSPRHGERAVGEGGGDTLPSSDLAALGHLLPVPGRREERRRSRNGPLPLGQGEGGGEGLATLSAQDRGLDPPAGPIASQRAGGAGGGVAVVVQREAGGAGA